MKPLSLDEIKHVLHGELKTPLRSVLVRRITTDSREVRKGDLFFALRGEKFDGHDYIDAAVQLGAVGVIADRSLPISETVNRYQAVVLQVGNTVEALGSLARYYRESHHSMSVIAVTGSNGKTTTREMIYHVLSKYKSGHRSPKSFNNEIGVPITLLGVEADHEFVVVEIGSNARGEVAALSKIARPDIAVITQVGAAHLAGFGSLDGVSVEKSSIVDGLKERGLIVCHAGHQGTIDRVRSFGHQVITFGVDMEADVTARGIRRANGKIYFETNDHCQIALSVGGLHNVSNALAALVVARRLGVQTKEFAEAIADFHGVPGRLQYHHYNGITVIDDTYNANPYSMEAAVQELESQYQARRRVLIVGDMGELGEVSEAQHRALGQRIAHAKIDYLLTVGDMGAVVAAAALEAGMGRGRVQRAVTSKRLARLAKSLMYDGDVILVKGSRFMKMEEVVKSLSRWRGKEKKTVSLGGGIQSYAKRTPEAKRNVKVP